jgi:hypothetical protein
MAVQSSARKWIFIGGGVLAAAALVVFLQNYPPQPKDASGTIGAAQRYHSTQITGADVQVDQNELTTWIQSETFDRIVKDPEARRLFTNDAVLRMFTDEAFRHTISAGGDAAKLGGDSARLAGGDATKYAGDKVVHDAARIAAGDAAKLGGDAAKLGGDAAKLGGNAAKLGGDATKLALQNGALRNALRSEAFCKALANEALRNALVMQARQLDSAARVD